MNRRWFLGKLAQVVVAPAAVVGAGRLGVQTLGEDELDARIWLPRAEEVQAVTVVFNSDTLTQYSRWGD